MEKKIIRIYFFIGNKKIRIRYMKKKTIITPTDDQLKNIATKHRRCSFVYYFFFAWV